MKAQMVKRGITPLILKLRTR